MIFNASLELDDNTQQQLNAYLADHPDETLETLLQKALKTEQSQPSVNAAKELLKLAGIAKNAPPTDDNNREELT